MNPFLIFALLFTLNAPSYSASPCDKSAAKAESCLTTRLNERVQRRLERIKKEATGEAEKESNRNRAFDAAARAECERYQVCSTEEAQKCRVNYLKYHLLLVQALDESWLSYGMAFPSNLPASFRSLALGLCEFSGDVWELASRKDGCAERASHEVNHASPPLVGPQCRFTPLSLELPDSSALLKGISMPPGIDTDNDWDLSGVYRGKVGKADVVMNLHLGAHQGGAAYVGEYYYMKHGIDLTLGGDRDRGRIVLEEKPPPGEATRGIKRNLWIGTISGARIAPVLEGQWILYDGEGGLEPKWSFRLERSSTSKKEYEALRPAPFVPIPVGLAKKKMGDVEFQMVSNPKNSGASVPQLTKI